MAGLGRIGLALTALLLSCLLPGCLQMEHVLDIQPDGSIVYSLNYAISEQAITQFKEAAQIRDDLNQIRVDAPAPVQDPILLAFQDPNEKRIKTALAPYESKGVTIDELELDSRNNWRSVQLRVRIDDMSVLNELDFFKQHGFSLMEQSDQMWTFWRHPHIDTPPPPPPDKNTIRRATPLLEGFETEVRVSVPGRILQTTAHSTGQSTATWKFDFDRDGGALLDLQHQAFRIAFRPAASAVLKPLTYEGRSLSARIPPTE